MRALAALGGLAVFVAALYLAMDWMIARELLSRGYDRSSVYWENARGMGLGWGGLIALTGVVPYAVIVLVAWGVARRPFSAGRLLALHAASLAATLLALHLLQAFGVLIAAPVAGLVAYRLLRPSCGYDRDRAA